MKLHWFIQHQGVTWRVRWSPAGLTADKLCGWCDKHTVGSKSLLLLLLVKILQDMLSDFFFFFFQVQMMISTKSLGTKVRFFEKTFAWTPQFCVRPAACYPSMTCQSPKNASCDVEQCFTGSVFMGFHTCPTGLRSGDWGGKSTTVRNPWFSLVFQ